ncbi:hypothetical protein [Chitinophaga silvisoli]|uniref:hypothetical protein n=1 Tax=Chitinophaga silvisoli TaxID=2291814 RepID=UPI001314C162|nr:hypothetical protein [Chitinophaga silvisoli]
MAASLKAAIPQIKKHRTPQTYGNHVFQVNDLKFEEKRIFYAAPTSCKSSTSPL